jgi:hypothetical protein
MGCSPKNLIYGRILGIRAFGYMGFSVVGLLGIGAFGYTGFSVVTPISQQPFNDVCWSWKIKRKSVTCRF